jgi:hypothetical protein
VPLKWVKRNCARRKQAKIALGKLNTGWANVTSANRFTVWTGN